ncbi:MAG: TraR/DksA C4-type zinc finger protein [Pseudomonadota bacterium]
MNLPINAARKRLQGLLTELDRPLAASTDETATVALDQQAIGRLSRMDLLQRQQLAKETERRRATARKRIMAALTRIDDDEYGWCASCGEAIPEGRLDADPTAAQCINCAA